MERTLLLLTIILSSAAILIAAAAPQSVEASSHTVYRYMLCEGEPHLVVSTYEGWSLGDVRNAVRQDELNAYAVHVNGGPVIDVASPQQPPHDLIMLDVLGNEIEPAPMFPYPTAPYK